MNYEDMVIWITGASSGIGEALALQYAKKGASLIISSNEPEQLERVRESCPAKEKVAALFLDLLDLDSIPAKGQEALSKHGRVDLLINNGGISQRSLVPETAMATYKKIMDIDFFGHVAVTKSILPSMLEQKAGHIAVTSSVTGKFGAPLRSGYSAAKHALHGFFDTLRAEVWKENIKVTIVCPTSVKTNISFHAVAGDGKEYGKMSDHLAKGLTPEEAARRYIRALEQGKEEVVIGDDALKYAPLIRRISPALFSRMLRKAKVN